MAKRTKRKVSAAKAGTKKVRSKAVVVANPPYDPNFDDLTAADYAAIRKRVPQGMKGKLISSILPGEDRENTTTLFDESWKADDIAMFKYLYNRDPNIWYVQAVTKDGKELLIFNGPHP